jgi:hypothetical protein
VAKPPNTQRPQSDPGPLLHLLPPQDAEGRGFFAAGNSALPAKGVSMMAQQGQVVDRTIAGSRHQKAAYKKAK